MTELTVNYTVRWYGEDVNETTTTNELSYIVTGLTANTLYNVIVAVMYCGEVGPYSEVITAMTNMRPITSPTTSSSPPNTGNVVFMYTYTYVTI